MRIKKCCALTFVMMKHNRIKILQLGLFCYTYIIESIQNLNGLNIQRKQLDDAVFFFFFVVVVVVVFCFLLKSTLKVRSFFPRANAFSSKCRPRCSRASSSKQTTVNSRYLEVKVQLKLLVSQSKFSGPRKFTLIYQQFEILGAEM